MNWFDKLLLNIFILIGKRFFNEVWVDKCDDGTVQGMEFLKR